MNLVLNTKDLVYVQSETKIEGRKDRQHEVVGPRRIFSLLPCSFLLVLISLKNCRLDDSEDLIVGRIKVGLDCRIFTKKFKRRRKKREEGKEDLENVAGWSS